MGDNTDSGSPGHARVLGSPGERARLTGLLLAAAPVIVVVGLSGYLLRAAAPVPELGRTTVGVLFLVLAVAFAAGINSSRVRLAAFFKGARGEEWIAHELAFLSSEYSVFNDLRLPHRRWRSRGRDCDHIVVGPRGVWVVETKNWNGRITVEDGRILCDGREPSRPPLGQVRSEASALRNALLDRACGEFTVSPVLCFAAGTVNGVQGVGGVVVCDLRSLNAVVTDPSNEPLPPDRVAAICAALERLVE